MRLHEDEKIYGRDSDKRSGTRGEAVVIGPEELPVFLADFP